MLKFAATIEFKLELIKPLKMAHLTASVYGIFYIFLIDSIFFVLFRAMQYFILKFTRSFLGVASLTIAY